MHNQQDFCGDILDMALSDKFIRQETDHKILDALSAVVIMAQGEEWSKEALLETVQNHWKWLETDEAVG